MKHAVAVAALVALATVSSVAQPKKKEASREKTVEELTRIERALAQASVNLDPAAYDRYWADDFIGIDASGGNYTKGQHRAALTSGKLKFDSLDVDEIKVRVFGDAAVMTSRRTIKGRYDDRDIGAQNRVTSVFVRRQGLWQKVAEHTSRIQQP